MDMTKLIKLLEDCLHALDTEQGLMAFDGACPGETFEISHAELVDRIKAELGRDRPDTRARDEEIRRIINKIDRVRDA